MKKLNLALWAQQGSAHEKEDDFLHRIGYDYPIMNAVTWLGKHLLRRLISVREVKAWYKGGKLKEGARLLSDIIDLQDKEFCDRFRCFCATLAKYDPKTPPKTYLSDLIRLSLDLMNDVKECCPTSKAIRHIIKTINELGNYLFCDVVDDTPETYEERLHKFHSDITHWVEELAEELIEYESEIRGDRSRPATRGQVEELSKDVKKTNKKLDVNEVKVDAIAKDVKSTKTAAMKLAKKKTGKHDNKVSLQELCWSYWEMALKHEDARDDATGQFTHASAFRFYRSKLIEAGVKSEKEFHRILLARRKRKSWNKSAEGKRLAKTMGVKLTK